MPANSGPSHSAVSATSGDDNAGGEAAGDASKPTGQQNDSPPAPNSSANAGSNQASGEQAAKKAVGAGADDTLLLAVLVLGFTVAVSGVVIVAGRRGGRRVH